MVDLTGYMRRLGRAAGLQTAAARLPHAQAGALGEWSLQAENVLSWQSMATPSDPHGSITMAPNGSLQIDLDDIGGWHPFVAVACESGAGRQFQVSCRYGWNGSYLEDGALATDRPPPSGPRGLLVH